MQQARDDQYEWECRQRQLQREQRHRERVEKERQRPPCSPPPVVHYTDHEASNVCEKIKQDDTFMKAVQVDKPSLISNDKIFPLLKLKRLYYTCRIVVHN